MAAKNRNKNSRPGIPDALHPEIGNGALWENQTHAFLLRSPDPSKELDELLNDPETKTKVLETWTLDHKMLNGEEASNSPGPVNEKTQSDQREEKPKKSIHTSSDTSSRKDTLTKDIEAPKSSEAVRSDMEEPTESIELSPESEVQKAPKAGKRVRKAVKTVSKQEAKAKSKSVADPSPILTESSLSPFTKWLKGLSGSDYVHPYDDDFAFVQSSGPGKEGISETFAELLAAQGHKERAVEMYLKLMEKYPEKSGFFAAKIEALQ